MFEHPLLVCYGCYHCGPQMTRPRSGAGVGDTEVAQCEAGKPAVVKVKHESWQAGIELVVFDLVAISAEIDMVLVGIFRMFSDCPKNGWKGNGATCVREQNECSVISAEHTNIKQGFLQKSRSLSVFTTGAVPK